MVTFICASFSCVLREILKTFVFDIFWPRTTKDMEILIKYLHSLMSNFAVIQMLSKFTLLPNSWSSWFDHLLHTLYKNVAQLLLPFVLSTALIVCWAFQYCVGHFNIKYRLNSWVLCLKLCFMKYIGYGCVNSWTSKSHQPVCSWFDAYYTAL